MKFTLFNLSLIVQTLAFLFSHMYRRIFINLRRIFQKNQAISLRELSTFCRTKNSEKIFSIRATNVCTAKNSHTTWVRDYRETGWKTWGRKTKYSRTNTVKDKVHGKTKYTRTNWVQQNCWQFAFNILCNVFDFLFENHPLKNYIFIQGI